MARRPGRERAAPNEQPPEMPQRPAPPNAQGADAEQPAVQPVSSQVLLAHAEAMDRFVKALQGQEDGTRPLGINTFVAFNASAAAAVIRVKTELRGALNDPTMNSSDKISKYDVRGPYSAPFHIASSIQNYGSFALYHIELSMDDFLTMSLMKHVIDRLCTKFSIVGVRAVP